MARLPQPGGDSGTWGNVLNDYLSQAHKVDGTLKDNAVTANALAPNSVTNAAIASDAVNATSIADGSITETLLATAVQTKLNANGGTPDWSTIANKPAVIAAGADANAAKATLSLAKSDVGLGNVDNTTDTNKPISTATSTALSGKADTVHAHTATDIGDSTTVGRSVLTAADAAAARAAIGAGTSNLTLGTSGSTAKAGDYQPASTDITDATATGRSLLTAADAAAARTAIGVIGGAGLVGATDGQDTSISAGSLVAHNPLYIDPTQAPYNVKFDRYSTTLASMSSSSDPTQLTVTGYTFTTADIGKNVKVVGAGAASANLKTTITGVSSGKAVLASPCLTTVSGAFCIFGTDNLAALNTLFDDLSTRSRTRELSRIAVFPMGAAMYFGTLILPNAGTIKGAAENWIEYDLQYARFGGAENTGGTILYQGWDCNADGARVRDYVGGLHQWNGMLTGFMIEQDLDNTSGRGISFRNVGGDAICIIDGGTLNRVAAMGFANEGFEFPGGVITGTFRDLYAFANGYVDRKVFTATTTNGSFTLTGVSDTTGLAQHDILSGPGIPVDTTVTGVGVGTLTMSVAATASASVTVQRAGSPGVRYTMRGTESVHFDGLSGDQNSGGLLKLDGPALSTGAGVIISNLKNEFGANVYREPDPSVTPSVPQGSNAIVLGNMTYVSISIRGLTHWADATSSVANNALGCDIGAAILSLTSGTVPDVTWEALTVRLAAGSGQTVGYAFRDNRASLGLLPIASDTTGKGTNRRKPKAYRTVADANTTISLQDQAVGWSTLVASRTANLPALSTARAGFEVLLVDASGSAQSNRTITATPNGADTIVGDSVIGTPNGVLSLIHDGARWTGKSILGSKIGVIHDSNGNNILLFTTTSSAVNYLTVANSSTGNPPQLTATGSDTNVSMMLIPKGSGGVQIYAGTGVTPRLVANGVDTNVNLNLQSKGTGVVQANGVEVVTLTGSQTLTGKTLTSPAITTPTGLVKGDVGLGNVDNISSTTLLDRANHTGTQSADTVTDGSTNVAFLATERTKLTGIATAATANSSDATLLDRANHTGTQLASTVSDLATDTDVRDDLTLGESTMSRRYVTSTAVASTTQTLRLSYFTARKTETINSVRVISGATAAGATPTLCRVGIYSIDGSGNIALVASTANDTALYAAASTAYTKALSGSFSKVRGTRYAIGLLVVTATTAPTYTGQVAVISSEQGLAPRLGGLVLSQSDLPASVAVGSIFDNGNIAYVALVP